MADDASDDQASAFLQALNRALDDLQSKRLYYLQVDVNSPAVKALLDLESKASTILSPHDSILSNLTQLKALIDNLSVYQCYTPRSFFQYCLISYQISRIALSIQKQIQLFFDRKNIENLVEVLKGSCGEEEKLRILEQFEDRISGVFDRELQNLILKARLFPLLESILCDHSCTLRVREKAGSAMAALAQFNRNVFVGSALMGPMISTLVLMGSSKSLQILTSLVKLINGHLVDEIQRNGDIPIIIGLLSSEDLEIRLMALDCLLEIAYFSRKEVIEAMIEYGLVEKLVFLQRAAAEDDLSQVNQVEETENKVDCEESELRRQNDECLSDNPFSGYVAKFAVQVEMGEVMEKSEKKEVKLEILRRARAASVSEAEAATVVAEVLWGSHPY